MYCGNTKIVDSRSAVLSGSDMTAIYACYTPYGFAVAADGRGTWDNAATANESTRKEESDCEQKIFTGQFKGSSFAYAVTGLMFTQGKTFDLRIESAKAISLVSSTRPANIYEYISRFSKAVAKSFDDAKRDGRIDLYLEHGDVEEQRTIARICFAGYFRKNGPGSLIALRFVHDNQHIAETEINYDTNPQHPWVIGSSEIYNLVSDKFADCKTSLKNAIAASKGYIDACSGAFAEEVDPACKYIGGHTHVATVTKEDGFQWTIPPVTAVSQTAP
jgi:hypothetical protein